MTTTARRLACGFALLSLIGFPRSVHAQLEIGTWARQPTPSIPGTMTLTIDACCGGGGRRLTYHVAMNGQDMVAMVVESRLDGADAPVTIGGKPSGETMAIKRTDATHASAIVKMNGQAFATSTVTLSADGKTLTVVNDTTSATGGQPVGKTTEVWMKK
jgi:hypothetical protein